LGFRKMNYKRRACLETGFARDARQVLQRCKGGNSCQTIAIVVSSNPCIAIRGLRKITKPVDLAPVIGFSGEALTGINRLATCGMIGMNTASGAGRNGR
jgi:hypothetical protein